MLLTLWVLHFERKACLESYVRLPEAFWVLPAWPFEDLRSCPKLGIWVARGLVSGRFSTLIYRVRSGRLRGKIRYLKF